MDVHLSTRRSHTYLEARVNRCSIDPHCKRHFESIDDFHNGGRSARPGENGMKTRSQRPQTFTV